MLWTLVLGLLLWPDPGYAHNDGCMVQDSLKFDDLLVDFVRFTAFTPSSGNIFEAKLACENETWFSHIITASADNITLKTAKKETGWPAPETEEEWTEFELKFGDFYEVLDGRGQSWIAERVSPTCLVTKVEISEGEFARHCPEGTLKWEVEDEKCASVPLPRSFKGDHTLNLTLMSRDSFSPVFHLGGTQVELGMRAGSVVASGKGTSPLEPPVQRTLLRFSRRGDRVSCELTTDALLHTVTLARESRSVSVCAKDSKFLLMLTLEKEIQGTTGLRSYLLWILVSSGVSFVLVVASVVGMLHRLLHRHQNVTRVRTPQQGKPRAGQERPPDTWSPYLEPRVLPHRESAGSDNTRSNPEHIYEEVDEAAFVPGFETYSSQDESSSAGSLA
ncbi:uncharacterized protein LOC122261606 isoform X2 [Penaeus japonicus]|uniref:uncharacterized protein LOC122261606 isoform X2 n=1 Tax=Penaeus japonicus TaxID=27405 RepID=UPI001C70E850|nr:uncharacterized protein LOC122261606 isoform X2 [Penaeus japonicus]